MTIENDMQTALRCHQAGRMDEAENLYRRVLQQAPQHGGALHLMGALCLQRGKVEQAIEWIGRAIAAEPNVAEYHSNLAEAYRRVGRLEEALASARRAVKLAPNFAAAHSNLGNVLLDMGRLKESVAASRRAIALRGDFAEAHGHLGDALRRQGRLDDAIGALRQAVRLQPGDPHVHNNLGNALIDRGKLDEAIAAYRQAIALKPDLPEPHNNLGCALDAQGLHEPAVESLRRAIELRPDYAAAYNNLGDALRGAGRLEEALAAFHRTIELNPNLAGAHYNLGNALHAQERLDEAMAAMRQAIALRPDYAEAYSNLGNVLKDTAAYEKAADCYRRAMAISPAQADAHTNLVFLMHYCPQFDAADIARETRLWNQRYAAPLARIIRLHPNDPSPERRLRIGYVSADFRHHVVGRFLVPLWSAHDHKEVEVYGYSDVADPDELTPRLQGCADFWRSICGISDEQLAEQIRRDRIDILVELALHTRGHRLLVFARKPAPVQVTYLSYCSTSGLDTIDYRLSDPYLDPVGMDESCYSEKTIRLPQTYWCYEPILPELQPNDLPALKNGRVTFGCLNNYGKVSSAAWSAWRRLLTAMPEARLIVRSGMGSHRDRAVQDIPNPERVSFTGRVSLRQYFQQYHEIDIALDPFPYGGGTTTCDALWMGVPVVTLRGRTAVGRAGVSLLSNAGLPQLIAQDADQYVQIARDLAADLPRLAQLRSTLRQQMEKSPLMDAPRFARNVESAYRQMWRQWCQTRSL
jgi:predicted O-linked N-acetylglucosamine transferase (SPINDLY family)